MDVFSKLRKMSLLLIDDDEWVRDSLRLYFENEGCKIVAVETAEEGLELVKNQNFDVIITDYRLPGMDGLEFIGRLPTEQANALKILISAYGNREVRFRAKEVGIQEFVAKPFTSEIIESTLARLISGLDSIPKR